MRSDARLRGIARGLRVWPLVAMCVAPLEAAAQVEASAPEASGQDKPSREAAPRVEAITAAVPCDGSEAGACASGETPAESWLGRAADALGVRPYRTGTQGATLRQVRWGLRGTADDRVIWVALPPPPGRYARERREGDDR